MFKMIANKKRAFLILSLSIFFLFALRDLAVEAKLDSYLFKDLSGLDADQKRDVLIGDLYRLVEQGRWFAWNQRPVLLAEDGNTAIR